MNFPVPFNPSQRFHTKVAVLLTLSTLALLVCLSAVFSPTARTTTLVVDGSSGQPEERWLEEENDDNKWWWQQ